MAWTILSFLNQQLARNVVDIEMRQTKSNLIKLRLKMNKTVRKYDNASRKV